MAEKRKRGQYGSRDPWLDLSIMLNGFSKTTGISIGKAIGSSDNTGRSRVSKPETITLGELKTMCRVYGIEKDALFRVLKIGV